MSKISLGERKTDRDMTAIVCVSEESKQLISLLLKEKSKMRIVKGRQKQERDAASLI